MSEEVRSSGPAHDSAGVPFTGRAITGTGFDGDTGEADAELLELLQGADELAWMDKLTGARLIVPIVAAPVETDSSGELAVDKETDMAVVTLTGPDGVSALPVFTGLDSLQRWNPQARPSPVTAAQAAQAAVAEGCAVMVLDVGNETQVEVRASMVWALAQRERWLPAHLDPVVERGVTKVLSESAVVRGHRLEDAGEGVLRIRIALSSGLDQPELQSLATRVGERLANDGEMRARIEGLAFAFEQA